MGDFEYNDTDEQNALIGRVQYFCDLVTKNEQTIGIYEERVYQNLVTAMQNVLNVAPRQALDKESVSGTDQSVSNVRSYTEVVLPEHFLYFLELMMESWSREAYKWHDPRSEIVELQYDQYKGRRPTDPVVTKVPAPGEESGEKLRCWPQADGPSIETFNYVPEQAPESIGSPLSEPTAMWAASYTLAAAQYQGSGTMRDAAVLYLNRLEGGRRMTSEEAIRQAQEEN